MSYAEQLERETEQTRSQLSDTLDELRAAVTPGRLVDQISERFSDGAPAEFTRNLKDQVVGNPLPLAIIGAGLAWLMLGPRVGSGAIAGAVARGANRSTEWAERNADLSQVQSSAASGVNSAMDSASDAANQAQRSMRDAAESVSQSARQTAHDVRDTAGAMADAASRTASSISQSTKLAGQRTLQTGSSFLDFCREQPLLLAGLGVAIGALMGALVPATETEDRLMGEASDQMKERAQDLASEQYDAAKDVAKDAAKTVGERALDAAQGEAARVGPADMTPASRKPDHPSIVPDEAHTSESEWRQPSNPENAPL
jgi:hypothetical protein